MIDFARLSIDDRIPYFQEVANRRGLSRLIVEKDFWVCFTLQLLFGLPKFRDAFVFKGGTSLSKVFGIIKRFSEDIDISIDPEWLGFGGEKDPVSTPSRSQFEKRWKELNQSCIATVKGQVQPALELGIKAMLGHSGTGQPYLIFKIDEQTKAPVIIFRYPTYNLDSPGYIDPQVKLEFGALPDQRPAGKHTVTPWVAEEFPEIFLKAKCSVIALEVERTFWEKATILHAEYHRPHNKPMRSRHSRDCYDLCLMAKHESIKHAMADLELFKRVVEFKKTYFHSGWACYDSARPGSLHLVPSDYRIPDLKADYRKMQVMFIEEPPSFDELLEQLSKIEDQINHYPL